MVIITHDDKELIETGQFFTLGNGRTILLLKHDLEQIKVEFIISEDPAIEANKLEGKIIENDTLQIQLINFWNKIGVPIGPDLLGTLNNRKLYMILNISGMSPSPSKQIAYSFYLGEAQNG